MTFAAPEPLSVKGNPKTCKICSKKVNNARAVSWEYNTCPKCDIYNKVKYNLPDIKENHTFVSPVTAYLDLYTPFEMRRMK